MTPHSDKPFRFKQFEVNQSRSAMRVGTDAVLLGCWARVDRSTQILDVGTGTGVIALIIAQRQPEASIEAIEIDPGSAEDAALNFAISPWSTRMTVYTGDFLKVRWNHPFDLIISNPPYFSDSLRATDPGRSTARHDDALPAEKFLATASGALKPGGKVAVIIPHGQLKKWMDVAFSAGMIPARICHVFTLADKEATRVMMEFVFSGNASEPEMESLLVERKPGEFSQAYKELTHEFYTRW